MANRSMTSEQEAELLKNYLSGQIPARQPRRGGCLTGLFKVLAALVFGLAVVYGAIAVTNPWSLHIGGRPTPLLTWHGYGRLVTKDGTQYPLYVSFFPSSHFSQLRRDGLRPTGGLQGSGWLCISRGITERLDLSGTIYGGWRSTDSALMTFRVLEWYTTRDRLLGTAQRRGYIDLSGHWRGSELQMSDRGEYAAPFRSGVRLENSTVTLGWGSYSDFKRLCAGAGK